MAVNYPVSGTPIGNELVLVQGVQANGQPSGQQFQCTTQAIANLASLENTSFANTAITTAGAGTLTAAGLVGGLITRSGPTAAYIDTVATAAQIVAALPEFQSGASFPAQIKNSTAFTQTLATATGVTLNTIVDIPPFSTASYELVLGGTSASPTVTFTHYSTAPIQSEFAEILATEFDVISSTTLVAVTGLSVPLLTSGKYIIQASFPASADANGGIKIAIDTSDTLTAVSMNLSGKFFAAAASATATATSLGSAVGSTAAVVLADLQGVINVNTGGTLILKAAQNASTAVTSKLLVNGFLRVKRVV